VFVIDRACAVARIEAAERRTPSCPCGQLTRPVARGGTIWLECASLAEPQRPLRRLLSLDFAISHTRQPIIDARDLAPAA
jgi:hypothetical protein